MKPKPPPLEPLPPAVPPDFMVVEAESQEELEAKVQEAIAAGMRLEPNTAEVHTVAGVVIMSQGLSRDPSWDKRARTRHGTQKVINIQP